MKPLSSMNGATSAAVMSVAMSRAIEGDEAAFARIVNAYHGDLVRVAYCVCGEHEAALDAVQAAWLIAWRKLRTVRDPERLKPWLISVAANEARHLARRGRAHSVVEIPVDLPDDRSTDPSAEIPRMDLVNALNRLSPDDRALVTLRYLADLDSAQIAPLLHISASRVRGRLMQVKGQLRKELDRG